MASSDIERDPGRGCLATACSTRDVKHCLLFALEVLRPEMAAALRADPFSRDSEMASRPSQPCILPLLGPLVKVGLEVLR